MVWSSTILRELTIHDNLYSIYENLKKLAFAAVSTSGYTKLRVTQSTTRAFEYTHGVYLVCINKIKYSELR